MYLPTLKKSFGNLKESYNQQRKKGRKEGREEGKEKKEKGKNKRKEKNVWSTSKDRFPWSGVNVAQAAGPLTDQCPFRGCVLSSREKQKKQ